MLKISQTSSRPWQGISRREILRVGGLSTLGLLLGDWLPPTQAYIALPPTTLGHLAAMSQRIMLAGVEEVDRERKVIVYRKVRDIKGTWPSEVVRHVFNPKPGDAKRIPVLSDKEWLYILQWAAEKGRIAVLCSEETRAMAHSYIDQCWYSSLGTPGPDRKPNWGLWHTVTATQGNGQDFLRSHCCGTPAQLAAALDDMLAGKEAVVPVVSEGTKEDLRQGRAKIQGLRVGLKILDYNPKRDLVGKPEE